MHKIALLFGAMLIGLGLYGYFGTPPNEQTPATAPSDTESDAVKTAPAKRSLTAFIPAAFGLLLGVCGALGMNPEWRKNSMHAAAGIALLGILLGGGRFLSKVPALMRDDPDINRRALAFTGILALICAIYLVLSILSFIEARRARTAKPV